MGTCAGGFLFSLLSFPEYWMVGGGGVVENIIGCILILGQMYWIPTDSRCCSDFQRKQWLWKGDLEWRWRMLYGKERRQRRRVLQGQ